MGRTEAVARSIVLAITQQGPKRAGAGILAAILAWFSALFALYQLQLRKVRADDFFKVRENSWRVDEDDYKASFITDEGGGDPGAALQSIGDMGFSGSTFFATKNQKYLVKSVPRRSEYSFFRDDLMNPYFTHVERHPETLFVRICDFLSAAPSLGRMLGLASSHHIIMDNVMYGRDHAKKQGLPDWEYWDLKPTSYFYPERDIAGGRLTSEATKSQLADEFHGKILLTREQARSFFNALEDDTRLLARYNAVDYSLFLVRMTTKKPEEAVQPNAGSSSNSQTNSGQAGNGSEGGNVQDLVPMEPPAVPPAPPSWRTGVPSPDGKHLYRASLLDFFWAKHKLQPRVMTLLVNLWNLLISKSGPMSITTTPDEYRERFLDMCRNIVEVQQES